MKKLLIASDIHGSAYYCEKLMERINEENADRILLLGDLLYHGPRNDLPRDYAPKRVIEMLNSLTGDLLCVRGNCDTEVDQMVLNFPIMQSGTKNSLLPTVTITEKKHLPRSERAIFCCAATHISLHATNMRISHI